MAATAEAETNSIVSADATTTEESSTKAKEGKTKSRSSMAKKTSKSKAAKPTKADRLLDGRDELRDALGKIEKEFGKNSLMPLGSRQQMEIAGISTGSIKLDEALGGKGVPKGRIVEIFGPESSGKTTLALHVIAHAQKEGGIAAFIDAEHALDPSWARRLGVDLETLLVAQPDYGEQGIQMAEMLVKSNSVDVIVIDSVAALVPKKELDGEIEDQQVGLQARLMSKAMRMLTGVINRSKTCVIFINQIREKVGAMTYGSPETTTGGRALKFYSSCRIDVRRIQSIKDKEEVVGQRLKAKVVKNKVAPPFRVAEFDLMYDEGISHAGELLDLGEAAKVVSKSGSYLRFGEVQLGQGRERARQFLREHPEIAEDIYAAIVADTHIELATDIEEVDPEQETEPPTEE